MPLHRTHIARVPISTTYTSQLSCSRPIAPQPHVPSPAHPPPTLTTSSRTTTSITTNTTRALARSRSRSLSISLSQEQEQRNRLLYEAQPKKRILNRKINISKPKTASSKLETKKSEKLPVKVELKARKLDLGLTPGGLWKKRQKSLGCFLHPSLSSTGGSLAFGQPKFGLLPTSGNGYGNTVERAEPPPPPLAPVNELEEDDDHGEEWMMNSSPDIVLLNPSSRRRGVDDGMDDDEREEEVMIIAMLSKPSRVGGSRKRIP